MSLQVYQQLLSKYQTISEQRRKRLQTLSALRLSSFVIVIISIYYYSKTSEWWLLLLALASFCSFLYLIRFYDKIKLKYEISKALVRINETEIGLLKGERSFYEDGKEYTDAHHPFSYDLDIFGEGSLYQFLNRTTTSFGKSSLSQSLLHPDTTIIKERQDAIDELSKAIDIRQHLQAYGTIHGSEEKKIDRLERWLKAPLTFKSTSFYYFLLLFPLATIVSGLLYIINDNELAGSVTGLLVVINLGISFSFARKMMADIAVSTDINKTLQQFSEQLVLISNHSFQSPQLQQLQSRLNSGSVPASKSITRLSSLFGYLDYVFNIFVSPLLNGFFLFHIHILFALDKWKKDHRTHIMDWLSVIGEAEALSSFANFRYNHPDTSFPDISMEENLEAVNMGHPLIRPGKKINNDISFRKQKFIVLTGSNMSGKSTFLRTLGINLVLARAGSAVSASRFLFFPYDVWVSMRITDSLQDSESFFYAELKRLETIIRHINSGNKTFILLDEILRGTNSNDKHNGTIGLIRKLVSRNACGIIATHDLSVADLSIEYPAYINNKCFESEIINDELIFDYKIKDGVCTKLSASFLMKKLGIIE